MTHPRFVCNLKFASPPRVSFFEVNRFRPFDWRSQEWLQSVRSSNNEPDDQRDFDIDELQIE